MHLITDLFFPIFLLQERVVHVQKRNKIHPSTNIKRNTIDKQHYKWRKKRKQKRNKIKTKRYREKKKKLIIRNKRLPNSPLLQTMIMVSWLIWLTVLIHVLSVCDVHDVQVMNGILIVSVSKQSAQHKIISSCWLLMFTCLVIKGNVGLSVYLMQKSFIPLCVCALLLEAAHVASPWIKHVCVCKGQFSTANWSIIRIRRPELWANSGVLQEDNIDFIFLECLNVMQWKHDQQ